MEMRFVSNADKEAIKKIEAYCFKKFEDVSDFFMENVFRPENCLGCYDGDRLGASLHILPFHVFFHGKSLAMGGIAGVATLPEYRHRHCASRMLVKSLEVMRERGQYLSMLGPFSYAFYRKYGWETGFHTREYTFKMEDFKGFGKGSGRFRPLSHQDISEIDRVYSDFMSCYNGAIKRGRENWEWILKKQDIDGNYRYGYYDDTGKLKGYIFYYIKDGRFHINELVYPSYEVKGELLRFVYYHSAQAGEIVWRVPADDNTILIIDNPRRDNRFVPGMMVRVVDVKKILEEYPFDPMFTGSLVIAINDPWAPWNDGTFKVSIEGGKAWVEKTESNHIDFRCSIQTFSQMVIGYVGIKEAWEMGKIEETSMERLEGLKPLFTATTTFMNDFF